MPEKIVITGMGAVTSIGHSIAETWANLVAGVSGVAVAESLSVRRPVTTGWAGADRIPWGGGAHSSPGGCSSGASLAGA